MTDHQDTLSEKTKLLAKTPLFKGLEEHEYRQLAERTHELYDASKRGPVPAQ